MESKRATAENTQREELSIELEGYRAALSSTRNALRVADDELAKEYAKTSELKIELSRIKSSLEGQLLEASDREQVLMKEQQDFMQRSKEATDAFRKVEIERDEAEQEIRKLRPEMEDLKRQASGAEEERDLSHRMYREVDFARKTAMQRLADAQASLALLTSDNEALKKDLMRLQQDADHELELKSSSEEELDAIRKSSAAYQRDLRDMQAMKEGLLQEKAALNDEVVRLQTVLAERENQNKKMLDKNAQLSSSLADALAIKVCAMSASAACSINGMNNASERRMHSLADEE